MGAAAVMSETSAQMVEQLLADLGTIVRRVQAGSLDQDTFYDTTRAMRRRLKALRVELSEEPVGLTDLGASIGEMLDRGVLRSGTQLLDALPDRARTYGRFVVIDGDRPHDPPFQIGA